MAPEDSDSVETIYRRYITMVRRQAGRILSDPAAAEDAAQDVFLRFFQHLGKGAAPTNVSAYLFRMTTNTALNHLRKNRRHIGAKPLEESVRASDPATLVRESLAFCDPVTAQIAASHFLANQTQEEIAAALDISRHTVRQHLESFLEDTRKGWKDS